MEIKGNCLVSVDVSDLTEDGHFDMPDMVKQVDSKAFENVKVVLKSINLSENIAKIAEQGFENCSNLVSIFIPQNLNSIGRRAFKGCTALASITLPEKIKVISDYTFEDCFNLRMVVFSGGIHTIGRYAFAGCSKLLSVTFSDCLTYVDESSFKDCSDIDVILINASNYGLYRKTKYILPVKLQKRVPTFEDCLSILAIRNNYLNNLSKSPCFAPLYRCRNRYNDSFIYDISQIIIRKISGISKQSYVKAKEELFNIPCPTNTHGMVDIQYYEKSLRHAYNNILIEASRANR